MKIVIKVGTQSILSPDGEPLPSVMESIVDQIVDAKLQGHKIVFVSSGAVGFGRSIARQYLNKEFGSSIGEKQFLASIGQHELMHLYSKMLEKRHFVASQILLTKQDFYTRQHYLNIARLMAETLLHSHVIPIINENDSVAIAELMFTDNDELASLIAAQIDADKLIILSNVEGVYTGNPAVPESELIPVIDPKSWWPDICSTKSAHGRGGMITKVNNAKKMFKLGITTHIASIAQVNVINRIINRENVGTTILPSEKKSSLKKWIAYGAPNGKVSINKCLYEIIKENKRITSILPVGVESCGGEFTKGDIVEIFSTNNESIGLGVARYDSQKLQEFLGQKNKPALIHYDYLYIF